MGWLDRFRFTRHKPVAEAMDEALAAANGGDYARALAIWEPLARSGVARAGNNIAACFAEGLGVPRDRALALKWLVPAAEAGDPVAERNLAAFHMQGLTGEDADYAAAARFYRRAAEKGDAIAQDMLSWMLVEGEVMAPDPVEARFWAQKAAEAGIASAMTRLGMFHHNAMGVERDPQQAALWWRRGAEAGDADAQAMLGAALHMGAGLARDPMAALVWLERATAGGSALAALFLGPARAALGPQEIIEAQRRAALPLMEDGL